VTSVRVQDLTGFRESARALIAAGVPPQRVGWLSGEKSPELDLLDAVLEPVDAAAAPLRVPRAFVEAAELAALHRSTDRWALLYRILWRIARGETKLMRDAADADVARVRELVRTVRREMHRMEAFVRFRSVHMDGVERFVAWYEPQHDVLTAVAPFFARRFPAMRWSILTPDACVHWDGDALRFGPGAPAPSLPPDAHETLWRTYYANVFNPARLNTRLMAGHMPRRYWHNLPEAELIPDLLRSAPTRVRVMVEQQANVAIESPPPAGERQPTNDDGSSLRSSLDGEPAVRVGVAGWDYPDWAGTVYPADCRGADRLRFIAEQFDVVEINTSFYRPVSPKAAERWAAAVADLPRFRFAAKLWRGFTHQPSVWSAHEVQRVLDGMQPLLDAGRLTSVLVQFPWSFRDTPGARKHLARIADTFAALPLHLEVRHACWQLPELYDWLRDQGIGWTNIDQPALRDCLPPTSLHTAGAGYVRLHGRNADDWFRADAGRDNRYDYSYGAAELEAWVEPTLRIVNHSLRIVERDLGRVAAIGVRGPDPPRSAPGRVERQPQPVRRPRRVVGVVRHLAQPPRRQLQLPDAAAHPLGERVAAVERATGVAAHEGKRLPVGRPGGLGVIEGCVRQLVFRAAFDFQHEQLPMLADAACEGQARPVR
jgi:probable DNA metabolism protein